MRVLQLTTDLNFAGAERVIVDLVRGLRAAGLECAVAGLIDEGGPGHGMASRLREMGVEVFSAGLRRGADLRPWLRLWRFARRWRPDVLDCHLFHAHLAGALLRLGGVRRPMVWTYHTVERRAVPLRRAFYRLLSGGPECKVYVSKAVRQCQRSVCGVAPHEELLYNGIDLAPFLNVEPVPGPVFGAVGRLAPGKGHSDLLRAFGALCRENERAVLRLAGDGPLARELQAVVEREGIAGRVEFLGFVEDVPGFLAGVGVFVHPSHSEGFGLALLEALAAGLPCIASHVDALPEVGGGFVDWVEPGEVDGLHQAMRRALDAAPDAARAAEQRRWATSFGAERMVEDYAELYRSLAR